ncbi:hypothetical protein KQI88_00545 [Alkaliphilus sp. MSJ-5]|uniref:Uncharacterized protein n=1 Tax=Alkaliphilus flagellatus TaxID=2841507 RepID=A0ABS6FXE0_9FIRM|nr:hypothetical protein [Alkaliphilus flagellatus]MBU5674902.1 hypothetical protein [Alkaliphilus flagellatus]
MLKAKKRLMILLSMFLVFSIVGCSEKGPTFEPLNINVNGTEILLGQSTLQTFIDAGYRVTLDKSLEEDIAGEEMPTMTYDVAAYVSKDNSIVGMVSFLNNTKDTIPLEECIVNEYEIVYKDPSWSGSYDTDNILVDNVNLKGMKLEDVKKAFEEKMEDYKEFTNPDGSVAIISFDINKVYMSVSFDYETKEVRTVKMKVFLSHFE